MIAAERSSIAKKLSKRLTFDLKKEKREQMRLIVYDTEVFCEDWLVVLKDMETGKHGCSQ